MTKEANEYEKYLPLSWRQKDYGTVNEAPTVGADAGNAPNRIEVPKVYYPSSFDNGGILSVPPVKPSEKEDSLSFDPGLTVTIAILAIVLFVSFLSSVIWPKNSGKRGHEEKGSSPKISPPAEPAMQQETGAATAVLQTNRAEAIAIAELCQLAGQPERIVDFLASGASESQVRQALLNAKGGNVEIDSSLPPESASVELSGHAIDHREVGMACVDSILTVSAPTTEPTPIVTAEEGYSCNNDIAKGTRHIVDLPQEEAGSVEARWAWAVVLVITFIAIVMFERETLTGSAGIVLAGALGHTIGVMLWGFFLSPILWLISKLFTKLKWRWYHWFNSAAFTALVLKIAYWVLMPLLKSAIGSS